MIVYQILPRLWGNGRFSGVDTESLEYFKKLGVSHVWYTGIIRHSTGKPFVKGDPGSPYAICDYWDVNHYLAEKVDNRMSEFEDLIKRTHDQGMKVIIDFVPNHIGQDYADSHGGIPNCGYYDYDWSDTLKIDYSRHDTWDAMLRILKFWAGKGVDGFRCDMVELVPVDFSKWVIAAVKREFPKVIFIAEVYMKERYREFIERAGFDYLYDKSGLYDVLRGIVAGHGTARAITWNWQSLQDLQPHMLNFLENHDEQRIASKWFAGDAGRFDCVGASLLFNTAPFMVYSGQEIGLDAAEGHEGRTSIFNWVKPEGLQRLYAYIHKTGKLQPSEQAALRRYKSLLTLGAKRIITSGLSYDLCYCLHGVEGFDPDKHFAFIRHYAGKTLLVYCNFSPAEVRLTIPMPRHANEFLKCELPQSVEIATPPHEVSVISL
ncbi:MAG: alpha-amylase family glycosyl hydrolase [Bacteroidia bacterium]|nr:alpha-amylase family glycosyl hydrolase [Bacteroidia bacterium]